MSALNPSFRDCSLLGFVFDLSHLRLHLSREFILGHLRGPRWFAWFTGVVLLWFVFACGISGYWLV
jgi:quinol-cytochrome oxidoreductase complex cytochrome b subunit